MAEKYGFRGAMMGGFNRSDVVSYISRLSTEHRRVRADLEEQVAELSKGLADARKELHDCTGTAAELVVSKELLNSKTAECERLIADREALRAEAETLRARAGELSALETEAAQQREALRDAKVKLAEIELAARDRAKEILGEAEAEAERVLTSARTDAERVSTSARAEAERLLSTSRYEAESVLSSAQARRSKLRDEIGVMHQVVTDTANAAISGLERLRPALDHIRNILSDE